MKQNGRKYLCMLTECYAVIYLEQKHQGSLPCGVIPQQSSDHPVCLRYLIKHESERTLKWWSTDTTVWGSQEHISPTVRGQEYTLIPFFRCKPLTASAADPSPCLGDKHPSHVIPHFWRQSSVTEGGCLHWHSCCTLLHSTCLARYLWYTKWQAHILVSSTGGRN